jgi:LacI family transcriptional regulator
LSIPVVNVSAAVAESSVVAPRIEVDNAAVAQAAFDHLFERGFRQFGYCGYAKYHWSSARQESFQQRAVEAGCPCEVYRQEIRPRGADLEQERSSMTRWLKRLPRPVGVMACHDPMGLQILEACAQIPISVPDEVAVIGVDNDDLLCDLSQPSLSSVVPDTARIGYQAAELLDRMLGGEVVRPQDIQVTPLGVETRQSTDVLAVSDPDVVQAIRYIREHACEGIDVGAVVKKLAISRRVLELRFRELLRCTPHEQIVRVRIQRAMQLLAETELPLKTIAERAGFNDVEYLSMAFKRHSGLSPREFRRRRRS